jgi:REP element-mobilizing transposase RayT
MSTYTQILYQIVFSTKMREKTLTENKQDELYKYIAGILKNKKCHLYRINGIEDHIHILTHIHPSISLSSLVKDIKIASSVWIKTNSIFPNFKGWQDGYGAFSYSINDKDVLLNYVKNQKEHHKTITFQEEYLEFLKEHKIEFNEKFVF